MIGDQLATDIYGGNRVGMKTCLVDPFGKQEWITRIFNGRKNREIHRELGLQYSW
jgi:predicted HAD superfamily phosphohydrolase YqeG